MCPSYQNWAPWTGQQTRQPDVVFDTEHANMQVPDPSTDAGEHVKEERLAGEVLNLQVNKMPPPMEHELKFKIFDVVIGGRGQSCL